MNYIIREVANLGLSANMYGWIGTAAFIIAYIYSLVHGKRMGVPVWKMLIFIAAVRLWMILCLNLIYPLLQYLKENEIFGITMIVNSIVRVVVFIPLIAWLLSRIFKMKFSLVSDSIALYLPLFSALAQLSCIFTGCCYGYPCEWGIYSLRTGQNHFPTPIVETTLTLLIFGYLASRVKGKKYISDGTLFPQMMILYGIMRFICELLRNNQKIFFGCSGVALHAVLISVVGAVWLLILSRKKEKSYGNSIQTLEAKEGEVGKDPEGSQGGEGC